VEVSRDLAELLAVRLVEDGDDAATVVGREGSWAGLGASRRDRQGQAERRE